MLREGAGFFAAALRLLWHPDRYEVVRRATADLRWSSQNRIPAEYLTRLFPEVKEGASLHLGDISHPFELPYAERYVVSAIASAIDARSIFEFGTFTGTTTRLLADSASSARVLTLDLPDDEMVWEKWIGQVVGLAFRDDPKYAGRILQHRTNSRKFDYAELRGRMDLVFVDASHELPDVLHDSRRALELAAPHGVVVWDDYQPGLDGVIGALNQLHAEGVPLARVAHTRLVVHRPGGFPVALPRCNPEPWTLAPDHGRPDRIQDPESTTR